MKLKPNIVFVAALAALAGFSAQAQTTYRWVDPASGRTIFSDKPPPAGAKQSSRHDASTPVDTHQLSYSVRAAAEKFPVLLYTSPDCGTPCVEGRSLLNGRGIPFTEKLVQSGTAELDELKKLTGGKAFVPVIVVGRQPMKGFQTNGWNGLLDLAGYPKTAPFGSRPAANPLLQKPAEQTPAGEEQPPQENPAQ